jgi:hypothetical protein
MEKIKTDITARWVHAVDHLIDKEILKSYVDLEMKTGILNQRVADYKRFVKSKGRPSYVSVDQVFVIHSKFGVSLDYIMCGKMPILINEKTVEQKNNGNPAKHSLKNSMNIIENAGRILLMEKKLQVIEDMLEELLNRE